MKIFKYILLVVGIIIISCSEDELTEYPGNIIIHGDILHLKLLGVEETADANTKKKSRFYAFSGGSNNDLSDLTPGDWTYELWIKAASDTSIGDRDAADAVAANGSCISTRIKNFELYLINDDDADFAVKYGQLNIDSEQVASMSSHESSVNLSFDEWFHVAISRSSISGITKFYINGTLIDSSIDAVWMQPVNDQWLQFNYFYRNGNFSNFFRGAMKNIRVSKIDRYTTTFTPDFNVNYTVDSETLLQLNLEKNLTPFSDTSSNYPDYNKIEIKGSFNPYYIALHRNYFSWESEIIEEYPVSGY